MSYGITIALTSLLLCLINPQEDKEDTMARIISDDEWAIMTIAQEAAGESYDGKVAVAEVIRNRTAQRYASDGTVAGTVLRTMQFSGWNAGDPGRIRNAKIDDTDPVIVDCARAWRAAKAGSNTVRGAVLYYNPSIIRTPKWARPEHATQVAEIGGHVFFVPTPTVSV